jgi:hypothetical protein
MIKIPYGKSDYRTLVEKNYFYQDRTSYIKTLDTPKFNTRTNIKSFLVVVVGHKLEWRPL